MAIHLEHRPTPLLRPSCASCTPPLRPGRITLDPSALPFAVPSLLLGTTKAAPHTATPVVHQHCHSKEEVQVAGDAAGPKRLP